MKKPRWRVSFRHRGVFYALGFFSCRVSFAFGDQLIQLDRSRSQTCTEPAAPILWPSGRILALRGFMALRADFSASRLYGPPGGFWRFAALWPSGRILALRGFMALRADFGTSRLYGPPGGFGYRDYSKYSRKSFAARSSSSSGFPVRNSIPIYP